MHGPAAHKPGAGLWQEQLGGQLQEQQHWAWLTCVRLNDLPWLQIYRFYYRCTNCAAEFTMKTDPKNTDYQLEEGATRNYEHWRETEAVGR
jgi:hypothetical protein